MESSIILRLCDIGGLWVSGSRWVAEADIVLGRALVIVQGVGPRSKQHPTFMTIMMLLLVNVTWDLALSSVPGCGGCGDDGMRRAQCD
jgi:hypothetical protein